MMTPNALFGFFKGSQKKGLISKNMKIFWGRRGKPFLEEGFSLNELIKLNT